MGIWMPRRIVRLYHSALHSWTPEDPLRGINQESMEGFERRNRRRVSGMSRREAPIVQGTRVTPFYFIFLPLRGKNHSLDTYSVYLG